jgi:hypothetical protein
MRDNAKDAMKKTPRIDGIDFMEFLVSETVAFTGQLSTGLVQGSGFREG